MDAVLKLDELMLEVGVGLVPLVDAKQGGQLLARVKSLRKNLAQQLGFPGSVDSHHRQSVSQGERVCGLSARRGDCALGDAARPAAGGQLESQAGRYAGPGDARAGIRFAGKVDHARLAGAGDCGGLRGGRPHLGAGCSSFRVDQAECAGSADAA